ncbi:MAG: YqaJ viral recombinase family protein [Alcanivoracaceae bacterium]|jgi:putative phage-type endonuclease|nr:YqaJ viral recombinase family protein [Alcanivoracaceae bacterium]MDF1630002.1 YqaJ viral recombinase family protein [Alcanivoracaceae bacterium]MDX5471724.1 YqaJ viral recombinase family protein [Marinobacter sp.]PKM22592.1 MAG: endonuclease [Gammaproteobacteria bacterium HGW-Gammaproteobacteria-14]
MTTSRATHSTQRPALRLVSTKGMSREDWLRIRKQGIGASDAAAACGISPYQSQLELWMIKTGRDQDLPKPDPDDMSSPMYWGNVLEPIVAEHYSRKTGNKVRRINAVLQHPDPDKHWMLANLDYTVVGNDDVQILECKTAGEFGSRLWRDGVPEYIQCQVQHQLAVTGKQSADVSVLLCGQDLQVFRIDRDEEVISRLIELERQFWHYVETETPPPADGSDSAGRVLQALYPRDAGTVMDLSEDLSLCGDFDELVDIRERLSRLEQRESSLKQRIQETMGDASKAVFPSGEVSWKRSQDSTVLDSKKLLLEHPELLNEYSTTRAGFRRFLIRT